MPEARRRRAALWMVLPLLLLSPRVAIPAPDAGAATELPDLTRWSEALSPEEREWIRQHPHIRLGTDPEFHPFEFVDEQGAYQGIASDYITLLNTRLGLNMEVVKGLPWPDAVAGLSHQQIDVLPCVGATASRAEFASFSQAYLSFQRVILTRSDMPFISGPHDIETMRVGVQKGSSHEDVVREHTPIRPVTYSSLEESLLALSSGKVDAVVTNLASSAYWIRKLNLANLKVAAPGEPEVGTLHFAVRKDWPELVSIINKGLNLISPDEKLAIERRWIAVEYKPGIEPGVARRLALRVGAVVLLVLAGVLFWTWRLGKEVARRRKVEEQLERNAKELAAARDRAESADRLKSVFLATMSHELRTPLNSIIGFTDILLQGMAGALSPEQAKQLSMVQTSARHLHALINDVLDLSKIEAGQLQIERAPFEFRDVASSVLKLAEPLASKKGLELRLEIAPEVGTIVSDQRRVEQVLTNLVGNAIKFTDQGSIVIRSALTNGSLETSVQDTGIGISPSDQTLLFRPFQQVDVGLTRKHDGTGLGLSICRRLMDLLGGTIDVRSEPGVGSTFTFRLPQKPGATP